MRAVSPILKPCPFCGGEVHMEEVRQTFSDTYGQRRWYGVVCRNTTNLGGTCCMEQVPSASISAATSRWNMRGGVAE